MKKYLIFKNWHYSFFLFGRLFGWFYNKKKFNIKFKFSNECWWEIPRDHNDLDLNKLIGLSFGLIRKNSIRISWVPDFNNKNRIRIYGYSYDSNNKEHISKYICDVETMKEYNCYIEIKENTYIIDMTPLGKIGLNNNIRDSKFIKKLYPYFGGNNKSPNKMYIWAEIKSQYN